MNNGKFFAGLALGALVGSALSCFAHSNRGRKLRRDVYDAIQDLQEDAKDLACLLYTSPSSRDRTRSRMPSSA